MGGNFLGRIRLTQSCLNDPDSCVIDRYRIPQVYTPTSNIYGILGWSIETAPDGDIVFSAQSEGILGRFDISGADSPLCKSVTGDLDDPNPCMTIVRVPFAAGSAQLLHSMRIDGERCAIWYSYWTSSSLQQYKYFSVGFAPLDLNTGTAGVTAIPGLYAFEEHYYGGSGSERTNETGLTVSDDGSVFFTDYNRRTLGRLTPLEPYFVSCP